MAVIEMIVTPEQAKEFLKANTANFRKPDVARINRYAHDMKEGRWQFNGDTVKLNGGVLLDGQHRLMAIVQSGVPVRMLIVDDISHAAGVTIDDGKPRTAGHWLTHMGFKNANSIAAMARWCIVYRKGLWKNTSTGVDGYSRTEVIEYAKQHHDNLQSAWKLSAPSRRLTSISVFGAIVYSAVGQALDPANNELLVWFCKSLATGVDLSDNEPVYHLRNRLTVRHSAHKLTPFLQRMLLTIAWNKTARGEEAKVLRYTVTGPTKDKPQNTIEQAPANSSIA